MLTHDSKLSVSRVLAHFRPFGQAFLKQSKYSAAFLNWAIVNHGRGGVDVDWTAGFGFNSHNTLMIFHSPLNLATER